MNLNKTMKLIEVIVIVLLPNKSESVRLGGDKSQDFVDAGGTKQCSAYKKEKHSRTQYLAH